MLWSAAGAYAALMLVLWMLPRPAPEGDVALIVNAPGGPVSTAVDYQPATRTAGSNPATPGEVQPASASQGGPGKRRTTTQDQEKEPLIGPERKSPDRTPPAPLD